MSATPPRTPPNVVPTLTEVVDITQYDSGNSVQSSAQLQRLPTLTEVVDSTQINPRTPAPPLAAPPTPPPPAPPSNSLPPQSVLTSALWQEQVARIQEELARRILQRIDFQIDTQLKTAILAAVQRQIDAMAPELCTEIEAVLRNLIAQALERQPPGKSEK